MLEDINDDILRFSIIGRPNTGKSSLINALLNEEKSSCLISSWHHKRCSWYKFTYQDNEYIAIDTAGLRKKVAFMKESKNIVYKNLKRIDRSDIVCAFTWCRKWHRWAWQTHSIIRTWCRKNIVIAVNKWDLVKNKELKWKKWL